MGMGKNKHSEGHLWYSPTEEITGVHSWGGWTNSATISDREPTLKIPGRREAKLLVVRTVLSRWTEYLLG